MAATDSPLLIRAIEDRDLAAKLSSQAAADAQKFSWEKNVKQLVESFEAASMLDKGTTRK